MSDMLCPMPLKSEVLKQNRWLVRFPADLGISEWMLKSAARPKITIGNTEIPFLNSSTYVAGRYKWEQIQMAFRDPIAPSASQALMDWIRLCAESVTGRMGYAAGYKRDIEIEMLDPSGVAVQRWILKNAWVVNADFGSIDYSQDDVATITAQIQMDYAILVY